MVRQVCPTTCISSNQNRSRNKSSAITEDQSQPSRNVLIVEQIACQTSAHPLELSAENVESLISMRQPENQNTKAM
ncbi:hypothetical protein DPMN_088132 [Dreissena polymorpha]|uniref:Uncharacterized protein n=1 Tax=Dreissena polymorpha TaxID=45954 RepID=A0A9D4KTK5_DREPO|nr:hypothetical protein DPMN_088132 [Dreissena polymorpha]